MQLPNQWSGAPRGKGKQTFLGMNITPDLLVELHAIKKSNMTWQKVMELLLECYKKNNVVDKT